MYYLCLVCGDRILHGWGLAPHFSIKHPEIFKDLWRIQRKRHGMWAKHHDYFSGGKLVAVCVGKSKEYYNKRVVEMWIRELRAREPVTIEEPKNQ